MDAPELTVARYAAHISLWALYVSAGALFVSACVFALELRRWFDEGVRLGLSIMVGARIIGGLERDDRTYLSVTVTNRGSAPTTITNNGSVQLPELSSASRAELGELASEAASSGNLLRQQHRRARSDPVPA